VSSSLSISYASLETGARARLQQRAASASRRESSVAGSGAGRPRRPITGVLWAVRCAYEQRRRPGWGRLAALRLQGTRPFVEKRNAGEWREAWTCLLSRAGASSALRRTCAWSPTRSRSFRAVRDVSNRADRGRSPRRSPASDALCRSEVADRIVGPPTCLVRGRAGRRGS
jgi:hypothetical protein